MKNILFYEFFYFGLFHYLHVALRMATGLCLENCGQRKTSKSEIHFAGR